MSDLRLPYFDLSPDALKGMRAVKNSMENSPLGRALVELIYLRVSQINGCAFCLKMHGKALRELGESNERLDALAGWRVCPLFSERESAALAWAEALTDISHSHAPDSVYQPLLAHFSDVEIADLTFAIANMNALNRVAIVMRH